jgi:hypothetical protein
MFGMESDATTNPHERLTESREPSSLTHFQNSQANAFKLLADSL